MLAKYMTAGLVGSALLATVAFAQTPTATGDRANMAPVTASDSASSSFQGNWRRVEARRPQRLQRQQ